MEALRRQEAIELDYEFSGKHVLFHPDRRVSFEGDFTSAEMRRFADSLDAVVTPVVLDA